jgi:hypothetical protein
MRDYTGHVRVVREGDDACTIVWTASFEAPEEHAEALRRQIQALFEDVLANWAEEARLAHA